MIHGKTHKCPKILHTEVVMLLKTEMWPVVPWHSPQNILVLFRRCFATIVLDVHEALQEYSVKYKTIAGYSKAKFNLKNNLAPAISGCAYVATATLFAGNLLKVHLKQLPKSV